LDRQSFLWDPQEVRAADGAPVVERISNLGGAGTKNEDAGRRKTSQNVAECALMLAAGAEQIYPLLSALTTPFFCTSRKSRN
jgi:hypothetical protein